MRELKKDPEFCVTFRDIDLESGGLVVVSDSSLGDVMGDGTALPPASPPPQIFMWFLIALCITVGSSLFLTVSLIVGNLFRS